MRPEARTGRKKTISTHLQHGNVRSAEDEVIFMGKLFIVGRPGKSGRRFGHGITGQINRTSHVAIGDVTPRVASSGFLEVGFVCECRENHIST